MANDYYIGIMSGTSLDGVDAVLAEATSGRVRQIAACYLPFSPELRNSLLEIHSPGQNELHRAAVLSNQLADIYSQAVRALLSENKLAPGQIRAIGCHGQTIRHRPDAGYTLQLNSPARLAEHTGITTISDFRSRDIAAGGQGAPLAPAFHSAMLRSRVQHRVVVNIGGISNLTDLPPQGDITGFDCGPGNLLMDDWTLSHRGEAFDRDGQWAASGRADPALLDQLMSHPFFKLPPPKSAGREEFNRDWLERQLPREIKPEDVQATLLAFTVEGIRRAIDAYSPNAEEVYLCGGGARNRQLVNALQTALAGRQVKPTDEAGIDADWMEALAFAWLAERAISGEPGNLPTVTGARHPCILGAIYPA